MTCSRVSCVPLLLLLLAPACVIHKDLLHGETSEGASAGTTGDDPGGSTGPTTGGLEGGESTGAPGSTSGDGSTGDFTTGDFTTTGGPVRSELIIFDMGVPLCMPVCARDQDLLTGALEANCQMYMVEVETQDKVAITKCEQVGDEWVIPAGQVRCYEELTDKGGQTPSNIDPMSQVCLDGGFNVEFVVIISEPFPEGVSLGATCEASGDPEKDCPNLPL
jgi:hypothetical protein